MHTIDASLHPGICRVPGRQCSMRMWIKAFGFAVIAEEDGTGSWQYDQGDQGAS
jgi:hypothetical protein